LLPAWRHAEAIAEATGLGGRADAEAPCPGVQRGADFTVGIGPNLVAGRHADVVATRKARHAANPSGSGAPQQWHSHALRVMAAPYLDDRKRFEAVPPRAGPLTTG
jgi:hypothetical protein